MDSSHGIIIPLLLVPRVRAYVEKGRGVLEMTFSEPGDFYLPQGPRATATDATSRALWVFLSRSFSPEGSKGSLSGAISRSPWWLPSTSHSP